MQLRTLASMMEVFCWATECNEMPVSADVRRSSEFWLRVVYAAANLTASMEEGGIAKDVEGCDGCLRSMNAGNRDEWDGNRNSRAG